MCCAVVNIVNWVVVLCNGMIQCFDLLSWVGFNVILIIFMIWCATYLNHNNV